MKTLLNGARPFLLAVVIVFFDSCLVDLVNTVPSTIVEVSVANEITGDKIADAEISIEFYPDGSAGHDVAMTSTTDANGFAQFKFLTKEKAGYLVRTEKDGYFNLREDYYYHSPDVQGAVEGGITILPRKKNIFIFNLKPISYLNVRFINQTPYNSNDAISVYVPREDLIMLTEKMYGCSGVNCNQVAITKIFGNKFYGIKWTVLKNNIYTNYSDSVFCKAAATTEYTINY